MIFSIFGGSMLQSLTNDESSMLAACEIMKYLDGWGLEIPCKIEVNDSPVWLDYNKMTEIIEGVIRYAFSLEPRHDNKNISIT
jgi:hypothetical protein